MVQIKRSQVSLAVRTSVRAGVTIPKLDGASKDA
jgi:hypothetical protein